MTDDIEIRPLYALEDMEAAVRLQEIYWGAEASSIIPMHMLFSIAAHGGHVLAALDDGEQVGVLVGLLGADPAMSEQPALDNLHIFSKRMVVLPDYRGHGLGTRLKLAQRDFALEQGIERVVWTFDPLLAPNAHLNIRKLGSISADFRQDYYGTQNIGGLSPLGTSDRLYVSWWLLKERTQAYIDAQGAGETLETYLRDGAVIVNPTQGDHTQYPLPMDAPAMAETRPMLLVEIPAEYTQIEQADEALARRWRAHNRATLGVLMERGYAVVDFVTSEQDGRRRAFYLLTNEDVFG